MPEDYPRPPADAYFMVQNILPPGYLVANQAPTRGRKVMVKSHIDSVMTYWEMDKRTAVFVITELRRLQEPVEITTSDYDNR